MRKLIRPLLLIALLLLAPVVPFLLFGAQIDAWAEAWLKGAAGVENGPSSLWLAVAAIALLWSDIALPIPSSMVSTAVGAKLGAAMGTLVSFAGMTLGAATGFALARRWGYVLARKLTHPQDMRRMRKLSRRHGVWLLVAMRPLPLLAEASVLLLGVNQLSWRKFLLAVCSANLMLAVFYSLFGELARQQSWLPVALALSVAAPIFLTAAAKMLLDRRAALPQNNVEPSTGQSHESG